MRGRARRRGLAERPQAHAPAGYTKASGLSRVVRSCPGAQRGADTGPKDTAPTAEPIIPFLVEMLMTWETFLERANRHVAEGHAELARLEGHIATEARHGRPTETLRVRLVALRDLLTGSIERRDRIAGKLVPPG